MTKEINKNISVFKIDKQLYDTEKENNINKVIMMEEEIRELKDQLFKLNNIQSKNIEKKEFINKLENINSEILEIKEQQEKHKNLQNKFQKEQKENLTEILTLKMDGDEKTALKISEDVIKTELNKYYENQNKIKNSEEIKARLENDEKNKKNEEIFSEISQKLNSLQTEFSTSNKKLNKLESEISLIMPVQDKVQYLQ